MTKHKNSIVETSNVGMSAIHAAICSSERNKTINNGNNESRKDKKD